MKGNLPSSVWGILVAMLLPLAASATPPCSPSYETLCRETGGVWTKFPPGKCPDAGSCSIKIPLIDIQCQEDADCQPCGSGQCKPRLSQWPAQILDAVKREPSIGWDYYSTCEPPANQSCACRNGFCSVSAPAVDCRTDSDCFYCCGSCQPTSLKSAVECEEYCILDKSKAFDCQCQSNHCRRRQ